MYLAIDIGGTKTLVGLYSESGQLQSKTRVETSRDYGEFIESIKNIKPDTTHDIKKCVVGIPGLLNREKGMVHALGNLSWRNKPMRDDISAAIGGVDVVIENDARLAGLAEALALDPPQNRVLYITISTGIGGALIVDKKIVKELRDMEIGHMMLGHGNQLDSWEKIASGKTLFGTYGMEAKDIDDPKIWQEVGQKIAYGIGVLCPVLQPQAIIFGGGVGQFAGKFTATVQDYLDRNLHPVVIKPAVLQGSKYGEENVLRGCYEFAIHN
jgi:glucokinase